MEKINILIADDHKMFREGLKAMLEKDKDVCVVSEAASAEEVIELIKYNKIDVVLMDIDMGNSSGIDATARMRELYPSVKVLTISMHSDHNYIVKMLEAGAKGYILKNTGKSELISAIKAVAGGDSYFSSEVSSKLILQLTNSNSSKNKGKKESIPLTNREVEVLRLIAQEYSNQEIADELFISIRTVNTHRRNLIEKLGVKNTAGLVKYAIRKGLNE